MKAFLHRVKNYLWIFKALWLFSILAVAVYYAYDKAHLLKPYFALIDIAYLLYCGLFIVLAKLFVTSLVVSSLERSNYPVKYVNAFHMYNNTQLAKYIPGGVWHFVGRAYIYRSLGMELQKINKAILSEQLWLLSGAFSAGISFSLVWFLLSPESGIITDNFDMLFAVDLNSPLITLFVLSFFLAAYFFKNQLARLFQSVRGVLIPGFKITLYMLGVQVMLGVSLYILIISFGGQIDLTHVIAASALSMTVSYIAVFAPAGVGVKEAAIMLFLVPVISQELAFLVAALHRLVYVLVDILLGLASGLCNVTYGSKSAEE